MPAAASVASSACSVPLPCLPPGKRADEEEDEEAGSAVPDQDDPATYDRGDGRQALAPPGAIVHLWSWFVPAAKAPASMAAASLLT